MGNESSEITLLVDSNTKGVLKARGITEEDIKKVIAHAEKVGEKLYQPGSNRFLAKMLMDQATIYVDYTAEKGAFKVNSSYKHKAVVKG